MPTIENDVLIHAPVDVVYALAKNVEAFPAYIPDVESLIVSERSADGSRTVTDWVGLVKEFKLKVRWTEEDLWDDAARTCTFSQIKGDYDAYNGLWTFVDVDGGTRFASQLTYDLNIPLIGPLLKALVAKLMRVNVQRILDAIKAEAERQQEKQPA